MKRETLSVVLLALLAVVALGVAAATLDTAVTVDGGSGIGGGAQDGAGPSDPGEISPSATPGGPTTLTFPPICYPFLREPPALLVFAGVLTAIGAFAYHDTESWFAAGVVAGTVGFPVGVLWVAVSACRTPESADEFDFGLVGEEDGIILPGGGGGSGLASGSGSVSTPEAIFIAVVVVALIASLLVLVAAGGDDDETAGASRAEAPDPETPDPELAAIARTAGEAAARIESADGDNEVYRAWREMTEALDVDRPASATPAEFATAAVAAGVDEEPVVELTEVFEQVRYGGADPTNERERRAAAALRQIEATHGVNA